MSRNTEVAVLAGGCFWGVQEYFSRINGVLSVKAGYSGGIIENPSYYEVCSGNTNHAEAVYIVFDTEIISYKKLLYHFFRIHNPTTLNRQGGDIGTQYRSAIFYLDERQKQIALEVIHKIKKNYTKEIVTKIEKFEKFFDAEEYHQDYLKKNPSGYCHIDLSLASKPLDILDE